MTITNDHDTTMTMLIAALILTIKTDGGFTGRGTGNLAIDGEKVTTDRCEGTLSRAEGKTLEGGIAAAKKCKGRDSCRAAAPDPIELTMEGADRKTSSYDNNDDVPKDIKALRDAAWEMRKRVIND